MSAFETYLFFATITACLLAIVLRIMFDLSKALLFFMLFVIVADAGLWWMHYSLHLIGLFLPITFSIVGLTLAMVFTAMELSPLQSDPMSDESNYTTDDDIDMRNDKSNVLINDGGDIDWSKGRW